MSTVGFIGLRIMRRPMLKNLLRADHKVVAFSSNLNKLEACSQKEPSARLRIVILARAPCSPNTRCLQTTLCGRGALGARGWRSGRGPVG
jgi:NAD binding domain of 6-phosphogluconate dehydrogenase